MSWTLFAPNLTKISCFVLRVDSTIVLENLGTSFEVILIIFSNFLIFRSKPISFASVNNSLSTPVRGIIGILFLQNTLFNALSIKFAGKISGDKAKIFFCLNNST